MSSCRVLILDDEPDVGETLALLVEYAGHEARSTTTAETFFEDVRTWEPTHLVIDLMMPGMDGVDVLARLAETGCEAAVIVSSGVGQRVLDAAHRFARANGLRIAGALQKPFGVTELAPLLDVDPGVDGGARGAPPASGAVGVDDLERALAAGDQLHVHYQPKVDAHTRALAGFEALARWDHPTHGAVPPSVFVAMAEDNALIDPLTRQVLDHALGWFHAAVPRRGVTLSVNVSARSVEDPGFTEVLLDACREHDVSPESVIVELTETSSLRDEVTSLRRLTRLRVHGFRLSLDDFGTGYASMSQLATLPFSEIKIDRSFVETATVSEESRALVRTVIEMGRRLGLMTVAEGVEDEDTLALLDEMGCDLAQGFLLSRPLPPRDAAGWVDRTG